MPRWWGCSSRPSIILCGSAVAGPGDFALALLGFALLTIAEVPPLAIVLLLAAGGMVQAAI